MSPHLSPHLSPDSCFVPEWLYIGLPAGDRFVPEGTERGQVPGSRVASGFRKYGKEEGCRRSSPCPHSVPSDLSPRSHSVPGRTPQGTDARKPHGIGLWEVRGGRGMPETVLKGTKGHALKSQHPWASGTKRPVLSPFRQIYATLIFFLTPLIIGENGDKIRDLSPKPMDTGFGGSHFVPSFVPSFVP